jgi:hypothetical protein
MMSMWQKYNPNPTGRSVGDCAIRAVAKALNTDWETAYELIAEAGYNMGDVPTSNSVWGAVLRQHGFYRANISNTCPDCYSIYKFSLDHPEGEYVLCSGDHLVPVIDGDYYDTWNSGSVIPIYYFTKGE